PSDASDSDCEVYEVEALLDRRQVGQRVCYLVKWKGWDAKFNSWEPEDFLNCPDLMRDFQARPPGRAASSADTRGSSPIPDGQWEVEAVLNKRTVGARGKSRAGKYNQYYVKWKNWSEDYNEWVNEADLFCFDLLEEYHRKHPSPPASTAKKPAATARMSVRTPRPAKPSPTDSTAPGARAAGAYALRNTARPDYTGRVPRSSVMPPPPPPKSLSTGKVTKREASGVPARRAASQYPPKKVKEEPLTPVEKGMRAWQDARVSREEERARRKREEERRRIVTRESRLLTMAERKEIEKKMRAEEGEQRRERERAAAAAADNRGQGADVRDGLTRVLYIRNNYVWKTAYHITPEDKATIVQNPFSEEGVSVLGVLHQPEEVFVLVRQRPVEDLFLALPLSTIQDHFPATYIMFRDDIQERIQQRQGQRQREPGTNADRPRDADEGRERRDGDGGKRSKRRDPSDSSEERERDRRRPKRRSEERDDDRQKVQRCEKDHGHGDARREKHKAEHPEKKGHGRDGDRREQQKAEHPEKGHGRDVDRQRPKRHERSEERDSDRRDQKRPERAEKGHGRDGDRQGPKRQVYRGRHSQEKSRRSSKERRDKTGSGGVVVPSMVLTFSDDEPDGASP
ncbi:zinc finger CCCH domain-containing protein 13-like, partial [Paramacrobiotus metropolitanus]|uniref:zinc finger CCCH domain-containing protein 13-like n=1 Tax=Paramacrobiotus metropolitanus TaxID=2943436 RepID=UPI0024459DFD